MTDLTLYNGKQLDLIRRTVARDCDRDSKGKELHLGEFDLFIENCKALRLDPLRRQLYAFVFHKDDPQKRQLTIVTSINGYRSIAERTGNYRPGKTETILGDAADPLTNPLGISHATATVYKYVHGDWHEVTETAYWSEFAPIKEIWENRQPTGKFHLDPKKDNWRRMPRVMLEKCAEAKALRRAWPDDFAGLYTEDEMDRAHTIDLTATEMANEAAADAKLALVGGKDALTVMWEHGAKLERVPIGQFCDQALKWASAKDRTSTEIDIWWNTNLPARTEYKAKHGAEYLEFQKEWEKNKLRVQNAEITQDAAE
jgi:phage recombination protein Bet